VEGPDSPPREQNLSRERHAERISSRIAGSAHGREYRCGRIEMAGTRGGERVEVVNQIAGFTVSQLQPVAFGNQRSGQSVSLHACIENSSSVETREEMSGAACD
jgi:hypothetical protein